MLFFYHILTKFLPFLLYLVKFFSKKLRLFVDGRAKTFEFLEKKLQNNTNPVAWFHCASLGEFEQGRPLIEAFRAQYPHYKILLTFFSPSGYEVRKNYPSADWICYMPLDSPQNAKRFVELVCPQIVFFVKYEFWYFFLEALHQKNILTLSISAIFREKHFKKQPYKDFLLKMLSFFSHIFVQREFSQTLLLQNGIAHICIAGDTRFDRVISVFEQKKAIPIAEKFKDRKLTLVLGSSWAQDIEVIIPFFKKKHLELKLIVAPHEVSENNLLWHEKQFGSLKTIRFSKAELETVQDYDVLLVDNVGMLMSLYQYANFAYVGGGFGAGLHNTLEPAVFGIPVFFGNQNYQKFTEAVELTQLGCGIAVGNSAEFSEKFEKIAQNENLRSEIGEKARKYVWEQAGATKRILDYVVERL